MNVYMVSRLVLDVGVSVYIMCDYLPYGLLRSVVHTSGDYGLLNEAVLQWLYFIRSVFEASIGLDALARLLRALGAADGDGAATQFTVLRQSVERRRGTLVDLEAQLATLPTEPAQHVKSLP